MTVSRTSGGSRDSMRRLGNSFTDSTSTNSVLRRSRCTGSAPSTVPSDRIEHAKMTTCSVTVLPTSLTDLQEGVPSRPAQPHGRALRQSYLVFTQHSLPNVATMRKPYTTSGCSSQKSLGSMK